MTHSGIRKIKASFNTEIYCLNSCTAFTAYIRINYSSDGKSCFTFFGHEPYPGFMDVLIEKAGGGLQIYFTMGEYDFAAIMNMPDEMSMLRLSIEWGRLEM